MKSNTYFKKPITKNRDREDKKFRNILIGVISSGAILVLTLNIVLFWSEIRFFCLENFLFGPVVQHKIVCMAGDNMKIHETSKVIINGKTFYTCSFHCEEFLREKFDRAGFSMDTITGKRICKSEAFIALKNKNRTHVLYFENRENLNKYRQNLKRNK